jgi:hypothetical protein
VWTYGESLDNDPNRIGPVAKLGIDETPFLKVTRWHRPPMGPASSSPTGGALVDLIRGNTARDLSAFLGCYDRQWLKGVDSAARDLHEGYRSGLSPTRSRRPAG